MGGYTTPDEVPNGSTERRVMTSQEPTESSDATQGLGEVLTPAASGAEAPPASDEDDDKGSETSDK